MKTSELTGQALDWAVAVAEGMKPRFFTEREAHEADLLTQTLKRGDYIIVLRPNNRLTCLGQYNGYNDGVCWKNSFSPSADWSQGGPIIEREKINTDFQFERWIAGSRMKANLGIFEGSTPLIAAMRCYCCAKLGEEIDIPQELQPCQQPNL